MPIREIAIAVVLDTQGRYLLQRRDNVPGIAFPGRLSLFGGHRESGESYLECIVREVREEISYPVSLNGVEHLTNLDECGEVVEGDPVHGEVFVLRNVPSDNLIVTEGSLTIVDPDKLVAFISDFELEFTPASLFGLRVFLERSGVKIGRFC
jgi:8-oxo-dGTP pyrophosphatase MutT (NUDIX family)